MRFSYPVLFLALFLLAFVGKTFLADEVAATRSKMESRVVAEVQ